MNNTLRNKAATANGLLAAVFSNLEKVAMILEEVKGEEEDMFNERSEGWQQGEKGEESQAVITALDTAIDAIQSLDLAEAFGELAQTLDRDFDVPEPKLSKQAQQDRLDERLPKRVKDLLSRHNERAAAAEQKARDMFVPWTEDSERPMFDMIMGGPLKGMEVPADRVKFPQCGITVSYCKHMKSIEIKGDGFSGGVTIRANASNVMYANVERFT